MSKVLPVLLFCFSCMAGAASVRSSHWVVEDSHQPKIPSRALELSEEGYFLPTAGLADDYPEESTTQERIEQDLAVLKDLGIKHYRFGISWDSIQTEPKHYDWEFFDVLVQKFSTAGITLLPFVAYTPEWASTGGPYDFWKNPPRDLRAYGDFMYRVVSRYKNQISSWELWTEPDNDDFWTGTADQYAQMMMYAAERVKEADPRDRVIVGGLAYSEREFLETLFLDYKAADFVDAVNVHGYNETWIPMPAEFYPDLIWDVCDVLRRASAQGIDVWFAEFGYSDYRFEPNKASEYVPALFDYEHTREYQAEALWKHHVLGLASDALSLMTWFRINDLPHDESVIGDANNRHLGIVDVNGEPKPAYNALNFYIQVFDKPLRIANEEVRIQKSENSDSVVYVLEEENGETVIVGWLRSLSEEEIENSSGYAVDTRKEHVDLQLEGLGGRLWTRYSALGEELGRGQVSSDGWLVDIELRGDRVTILRLPRR